MKNPIPTLTIAALAVGLLAGGVPGARARQDDDPPLELKDLKNAKKPRGIKQGPPMYPREMARAWVVGSVTISFVIDKSGDVRNAYVVESNNPWFERPALDAMEKWKFSPAELDGRPVNTRALQRIDFNMKPAGRPLEIWRVTKSKDHDKLPTEFQWETPPMPKMTLFPIYPFEQLKAGTAGKARVSYLVGPQGQVLGARLQEATAPEFGAAVLAMIDGWQFKPATRKDGKPAHANLGIEYEFKPGGRGDVPVSDETRRILRLIEKSPEDIATLQELDGPLKPLSRRPPVYPTALQQAGESGMAAIEFHVDRKGDVHLPRVVSSTAPEFGYAAVQAVATWRFEPPRKKGREVVARVQIPINFALRDPRPPAGR